MLGRSRINSRRTVPPTLPSSAPKRLSSEERSFRRLSTYGPPSVRNPNTHPESSSWKPSLAAISESPSPRIPAAAYAGSDCPPSPCSIAADPIHLPNSSFLTRSSDRIKGFLPHRQRNDADEDIPPAYHV